MRLYVISFVLGNYMVICGLSVRHRLVRGVSGSCVCVKACRES